MLRRRLSLTILLLISFAVVPASPAQTSGVHGMLGSQSGEPATDAPRAPAVDIEAVVEEASRRLDDQVASLIEALSLEAKVADPARARSLIRAEAVAANARAQAMLRETLAQLETDGALTEIAAADAVTTAVDRAVARVREAADAIAGGAEPPPSPEGRSPAAYIADLTVYTAVEGNTPRNWLLAGIAVVAGLLGGWIAAAALIWLRARAERRKQDGRLAAFIGSFPGPVNLAIFTTGIALGLQFLRFIPYELQPALRVTVALLYNASIFWLLWNLAGVVTGLISWTARKTRSNLDQQIIPLIRKTLRLVLVVFFLLYIAQEVFKQDITSFLAGLGIAGLAVSLAAQDSLKNLFGSITIFGDRPFAVGQAIRFGGHYGAVEDIGFRSTKVRTFEGTLVTIPNSKLVSEDVENVGARPYIRRWFTISVTYDTPPAKVREAVEILHDILRDHEGHRPAYPPRVMFEEFGASSLDILVVYYYHPADWWAYLEFSHNVNLQILERFNAAGIDFALPTQTLYLAGDEKRRLAVEMLGRDLGRDSEAG